MKAGSTTVAAAAAVALAAAAWIAAPAPAPAQQEEAAPDDPWWIGVGFRQSVRCRTRVEASPDAPAARSGDSGCSRAIVARAVVDDAPADRAGVRPGDTLVAVNGRALSRESGREAIGDLEAGRPAQLLIGRPGEGRISVRVVPEPRPDEVPASRVRVAESAEEREAPGDAGAREAARGDAERPAAVVFGTDEDGRLHVRWRGADSAAASRLGERASRLEAIRDSVLAQARRHIQALREHQRRSIRRAREAVERRAAAGDDTAEDPAGAAGLAAGPTSVRAAGAEFRPLGPSMAGYFPGTDRGLLVIQVVAGTPADELGLEPGDVVVEAGGRAVAGPADLREAFEDYPSRDSVVVKWVRKGEEATGVLRRQ